jgi:hypothetical protein
MCCILFQKFQEELRSHQECVDKIRNLAEDILLNCHPNAIRFVKYYLTITQTRWDQVNKICSSPTTLQFHPPPPKKTIPFYVSLFGVKHFSLDFVCTINCDIWRFSVKMWMFNFGVKFLVLSKRWMFYFGAFQMVRKI